MPSDSSPDSTPELDARPRFAAWLTGVTIALLAACLLLISPDAATEKLRPWPAHGSAAWLLEAVRLQALYYAFPTSNGVEIKEVAFHVGACLLSLIGGIALLARPREPALTARAWRSAARSPAFWFVLAVVISALSARYSGAPRAAAGGTVIRLLWLLWWWPLALLLRRRDARRVMIGLLAAAGVMAALGLWYQHDRAPPGSPLTYPMGSPLFVAACLLPAMMIAGVLAVALLYRASGRSAKGTAKPPIAQKVGGEEATKRDGATGNAPLGDRAAAPARGRLLWQGLALTLLAAVLFAAQSATQSRSARMGFGCGLLIAVYLAADRFVRAWMLATLAVSCGLIAGGLLISGDISASVTSTIDQFTGRSASIRARVEHEWPFAAAIFLKHPWLGAGEGGFGRMVGPYVRGGQLDDPTLLNADAKLWESHAHNEVLEMLTSIGLLGTSAMLMALLLTLRAARRAAEAATDWLDRAWIIAVTAAFVAAAAEELTDIALHKQGFAPVALTVWACLCVIARNVKTSKRQNVETSRSAADDAVAVGRVSRPDDSKNVDGVANPDDPTSQESPRTSHLASHPSHLTPRTSPLLTVARLTSACIVLTITTIALGLACFNATAYRAYHQSNKLCGIGQFQAAIPPADRSETWLLDPARFLDGKVLAAHCRVRAAQQLALSHDPADIARADQWCREALDRVDDLLHVADRFLRGRELEAAAATFLAQTAQHRGDVQAAAKFAERARRAWRLNRDNEPFQLQALRWLWDADPSARADERLRWLRDLMRGGEVEPPWDDLLRSLGDSARTPLREMLETAVADLTNPAPTWRDALSPETFRLAARAACLFGDRRAAVGLAANAVTLYGRGDRRLDRAHGAALHEHAAYLFDADPERAGEAVGLLRRGYELINGVRTAGPFAGNMGRTQLPMLLYLGALDDARAQANQLAAEGGRGASQQILAAAYVELVARFGDRVQDKDAPRLLDWAQRAAALDPPWSEPHRFTAAVALRLNRHDLAADAIRAYRRTEPRTGVADAELARLRRAYPASPAWGAPASSNPSGE